MGQKGGKHHHDNNDNNENSTNSSEFHPPPVILPHLSHPSDWSSSFLVSEDILKFLSEALPSNDFR